MTGGAALTNNWPTRADDLYVVGNFNGDALDEVLLANPDGRYQTVQATFGNSGNSGPWKSLQFASNGDIDVGDQLVAGDFTGNGVDEVMLIKANGHHYINYPLLR